MMQITDASTHLTDENNTLVVQHISRTLAIMFLLCISYVLLSANTAPHPHFPLGGLRGSCPVCHDGDSARGQKVEAQSAVGRHPVPPLLQRRPRPDVVGQLHGPVPRCRGGPERRADVALEEEFGRLPSAHAGEAAGGTQLAPSLGEFGGSQALGGVSEVPDAAAFSGRGGNF